MLTPGVQPMPVTGGKYLEASPPNTALIRNRVKEAPEKKPATEELQLWMRRALAFAVGRGCVPAVSRRGRCYPSWAPCRLPFSSPAGEIRKEIINSRWWQRLAGGLQAGPTHAALRNSRCQLWSPRPGGHVILACH